MSMPSYQLTKRSRLRNAAGRARLEKRDQLLRESEIKFLRLQTVFSVIGIFLSATLSVAGLWIGFQLNAASERQRLRDQDLARSVESQERDTALKMTCISQVLSFNQSKSKIDDAEFLSAKKALMDQCKSAGIAFDREGLRQEIIDGDINLKFMVLLSKYMSESVLGRKSDEK